VPSAGMPKSLYSPSKGCNDRDLGQVDQIPIPLIAVSLIALTSLLPVARTGFLERYRPQPRLKAGHWRGYHQRGGARLYIR
jgi:hypothetical protein